MVVTDSVSESLSIEGTEIIIEDVENVEPK